MPRPRLSAGAWFIIVMLVLLLGASVWMAVNVWVSADEAAGLSTDGAGGVTGHGIMALVLGGIGSVIVGGGLMALVFFSNRSGHDAAVHEEVKRHDPNPDGDEFGDPRA
ncbi:MAG: hypothetical protein RLY86_805 [Pseudomonadota bacterium]